MSEGLILGQYTVGAQDSEASAPPTDTATPQSPADNTSAQTPPPANGPAAANIFKEMGIDEAYGRSLLQAASDPAKLQEWMDTMSTDPQTLTVEQALRMDTKSRYPGFTPEEIAQETAFRMRSEFFQSEDADPNDKIRGDKKLQALLGQAQEGLSQKRAAFTTAPQSSAMQTPAPQVPTEDTVALPKDAFFQTFNEARKLSFGSGEEKYHYDMSGVNLDKYASDPAQIANLILNEDGSVNGRSVAILEALKRNPNLFDDVHKHGGTVRQVEEFEERHNGKERGLPPAPSKEGHKVLGGRFTVGG